MLELIFYVWRYYDYLTAIRTMYENYHYYQQVYTDVKDIITYVSPLSIRNGQSYEKVDIEMEILNEDDGKWCCVNTF